MTVGLFLELPGDWMDRAACGDRRDDLFFPTITEKDQLKDAKAICARCPVRVECLTWALNAGSGADYGVWGGLGEEERRALLRGRRRPLARDQHGTRSCYETGCRCDLCRKAKASSNQRWRARAG